MTGGAGFIGSHLCRALVDVGAEISVIDDLTNGRESNLADTGVRFVRGSILDQAALGSAVAGAEVVFHLAAVASVPRSVREPNLYLQVNAIGTLHVLEAARAAGASRVVYAASSSAYGDQPGLPRVETMPVDVRSPYAAAKVTGEHLMRAYAQCYDVSTVSLRYFNIFGPRQRADSPYAAVLPLFVRALKAGERPVVYGDGRQTRDFTHVANAVRANLLAGACPTRLTGEVVNVACGASASVLDLLSAVAEELGVEADPVFADARPGDARYSLADVTAARELLGYEPTVGFREGLAETVRYYAQEPERET